jgi:AcrR family transcriptional regulator
MTACHPSGPGAPGSEGARGLRADAARNRAAILAVARDVFAEQGLEAPLEVIAARAGVGIATLYRRFPTREKLVAAALVEKIAQYAQAAEQALEVPDPWAGFAWFVQRICELQACDRGLGDLLSRSSAGRLTTTSSCSSSALRPAARYGMTSSARISCSC